jgi:lysozyme family protein
MERFESLIRHTLKWEGGYINDPDDRGGETKYGITKRQYPNLDIKNLTVDQAVGIYHKDYWKSYMDEICSYKVAGRLFDLSVNMGHRRPNKLLQHAVNRLGGRLVVDGDIGPKSIAAINACNEDELYKQFYYLAKRRYEKIAKIGNNHKFLRGWMNRLNDEIKEEV